MFIRKILDQKKIWIPIILIFTLVLIFLNWPAKNLTHKYGVTFSAPYATELRLEPEQVLEATFSDLGFKKVRLVAYWDEIEVEKDKYDFSNLDWQIKMAEKYNAEVILAVGRRVPRWPECHVPEWTFDMPWNYQQKEILDYVEVVVNRYKNSPAIKIWQVENEPFLTSYAKQYCGKEIDEEFLKKEIALVKSLDNRPVLITDSGELSNWYKAFKNGDIFGSTMYLYVANQWFDDIRFPIPANLYNFKIAYLKMFDEDKPKILAELAIEPWLTKPIIHTPLSQQLEKMNLERAEKILNYAHRTNFEIQYLWGVEWWYFLTQKGNYEIWNLVRDLNK